MASIFDVLIKQKLKPNVISSAESAKININQPNSIQYVGYGEDDNFENAGSFDDFVDNSDTIQSDGFSGTNDFSDGGFGNPNEDPNSDGNIPKDALEFLENVDEDEAPIVQKVISSFSALYQEQSQLYDKLLLENLDTSEYSEQVKELKNQFRITLDLLKDYLINKISKESTSVRVETFVEFKFNFQVLNDALSKILNGIKM